MNAPQLHINEARFRADFEALARIGATENGGVHRLALSNEDLAARAWFANRMEQAGLLVRDDDAGNLSGVLACPNPDAPALLLGSHLDSVPDGGKYDGAVGLLGALECARVIQEAGLALPVHLEIINFTDEEGCWMSLFGSRGLTGKLEPLALVDVNGRDNGAFRAALYRAGIRPADIRKAARNPASVAGYLELHIEQGARLYEAGVQIGVVTGIVGRTTYRLIFLGEAAHSGTTTPDRRRDALLGASAYIQEGHRYIREVEPAGLFHCGKLEVFPGAFNIIPERAVLTMECRHPDEATLTRMEADLLALAETCASAYGLSLTHQRVIHMPAAPMDARMMAAIEEGCRRAGVGRHTRLVSYAGHDGQMMSDFTPSGMIFIPSVNGISHNPKEFTEWADVVAGVNVLLCTTLALIADAANT